MIEIIFRQETKNPPITRIKAGLMYVFGLHKTSNWWRGGN